MSGPAGPGRDTLNPDIAPNAPLRAVLAALRRHLAAVGIDPAEAGALLTLASGIDAIGQIRDRDSPLPAPSLDRLTALLDRRLSGVPFSRLAGEREFWSLRFRLAPDTLDPRADSETLVEAALDLGPRDGRLLDLGTGTGCLAIAILSERPAMTGIGVDRAPGAAAAAAANAVLNGVGDRFRALVGDWDTAVAPGERFDLIVSNPPYISTAEMDDLDDNVRDHDPPLALVAGTDGLDAYRLLFPAIRQRLTDRGLAVVELSSLRVPAITGLAEAAGLRIEAVRVDLAGHPRALVCRAP